MNKYLICLGLSQSTDFACNTYRNDPKFSGIHSWANSVDTDQTAPTVLQDSVDPDQIFLEEQSDQGLHCLPFCLHLLDSLLYG